MSSQLNEAPPCALPLYSMLDFDDMDVQHLHSGSCCMVAAEESLQIQLLVSLPRDHHSAKSKLMQLIELEFNIWLANNDNKDLHLNSAHKFNKMYMLQ